MALKSLLTICIADIWIFEIKFFKRIQFSITGNIEILATNSILGKLSTVYLHSLNKCDSFFWFNQLTREKNL